MSLMLRIFSRHHVFYFLTLLVTSASCASETPDDASREDASTSSQEDDPVKASEALYDPEHLVEVKITMDSDDWALICNEGRSLTDVYSGCGQGYQYTWVKATVTVDGKTFKNVAVRKKGFLGSLSQVRPGLKVDFNRYVKGQKAWGIKSMTLNNDRQDNSHTHQCMAYQLFSAAGSPAPRCNFAKVTVNGKDLGFYSHVESIKTDFLARFFDDTDGNLYEGSGGADFDANAVANFQLKTNEQESDRSDLDRVVKAMEAEEGDLYSSLEDVFDMDAFLTYWAMEAITGHWDSYSGDQNNFYTYHDPKKDKFYFIPWGTDDAFNPTHPYLPTEIPKSAYAWSWPTYRLYSNPDSRAAYQQRLRYLLDKVWDEEKLLKEVDRIGALVSADENSLEAQREFIRTRKQTILEELDSGAPDWSYHPKTNRAQDSGCIPRFDIVGRFDTTWGDLTTGVAPSSESFFEISGVDPSASYPYDLHIDEISQPYTLFLASAGFESSESSATEPGQPAIWIVGFRGTDRPRIVVPLMFERSLFGAKELPFYAFETFGAVAKSSGSQSDSVTLGLIGDGKVVFDEVGTEDGDRVKGSFTGVFVPMIFDQLNQSP